MMEYLFENIDESLIEMLKKYLIDMLHFYTEL